MSRIYTVQKSWFNLKDVQGHVISSWCKQISESTVSCCVCQKNINCSKKGYAALRQHVSTDKHMTNAKDKLSANQLTLQAAVPQIIGDKAVQSLVLVNKQEACTKAELLFALKSVQCNMAAGACDNIKKLFDAMFPGAVPQNFSLGRTKMSYYITEALGPYFHDEMLLDIKGKPYTLLYDETSNAKNQKELQLSLRFWSSTEQITTHHLKTFFLGHAAAEDIKKHIRLGLNESGLSFCKLVSLSSDGPNVNKTVFQLINKHVIDERGCGLVDIGTCNLHLIHNTFSKAVDAFGDTATELVLDIYNFFKKWPSRWEDFEKIQEKLHLPNHRFLKHVSTRWLTLGAATERVLEQFDAINEYFLKFVPNKCVKLMESESYKRISKALHFVDVRAQMQFICESADLFVPFLTFFQRTEPLIHLVYTEIRDLIRKIAGRVCKKDKISLFTTIQSDQLLPISEVFVSQVLQDLMITCRLHDSDIKALKHKMQKYYIAGFNYLVNKLLPLKNLAYFQCLQPAQVKQQSSVKHVCELAKLFKFLAISETKVRDEWLLLQSEFKLPEDKKHRIDHVWKPFIEMVRPSGDLMYPNLALLIKACFTLCHGNSDVERGFSISKYVMPQEKCLMSGKMLNARLTIKESLRKYQSVADVPITKKLLNMAYAACASHRRHLEEEKREKEIIADKEKVKKEEEKQNKMLQVKVTGKKEVISSLEEKAKELLKEQKTIELSTDALLKEGNDKLQAAIKTGDKVQIKVAHELLQAAERSRTTEKQHQKEAHGINQTVHKRKSALIELLSSKRMKK